MSNSNEKEVVRGKRYTLDQKSEVVSYVTDYNAKNGRGGQSSAAKKFKISQLTISTWLKNAGVSSKLGSSGAKGSVQTKLTAMMELGKEIDSLQEELEKKRSKFETLKSAL